MNIVVNIPPIHVGTDTNKMAFIFNAIETGWSVKKRNGRYIFSKKHNNESKYLKRTFINDFVNSVVSCKSLRE
jgi:hypothetical protein